MKIALIIGILSCFTLPLVAQEKTETPKSKYEPSGKKEYQEALVAKKKGEYEKALSLLEKASFKESNALYLFEYAILLDLMGDTVQAIRVLDRNAEAMKVHSGITTYSLVRQKFQNKIDAGELVEESPSLVGPILTITGTATTIAGIVFIVLSQGTKSEANCSTEINPRSRGCDNPAQRTREEIREKFATSNTQLLVGSILTTVGVVGASVGTIIWLNNDTKVSTALNPLTNNYSINVQLRF